MTSTVQTTLRKTHRLRKGDVIIEYLMTPGAKGEPQQHFTRQWRLTQTPVINKTLIAGVVVATYSMEGIDLRDQSSVRTLADAQRMWDVAI